MLRNAQSVLWGFPIVCQASGKTAVQWISAGQVMGPRTSCSTSVTKNQKVTEKFPQGLNP